MLSSLFIIRQNSIELHTSTVNVPITLPETTLRVGFALLDKFLLSIICMSASIFAGGWL